jgi:thiol:disulfide interchange protein
MSKQHKTARTSRSKQAGWQIAAVVSVLIIVAAVLALKNRTPSATAPAVSSVAASAASGRESDPAARAALAPADGETPQAHLDRMLAEGYPILAFFHSTTCYQCTEMTRIVGEVYPDFADQVALVGVNVYDEGNRALLQLAGIRVIPTLIFIDHAGMAQGFTGIMAADQLRVTLAALARGDTP